MDSTGLFVSVSVVTTDRVSLLGCSPGMVTFSNLESVTDVVGNTVETHSSSSCSRTGMVSFGSAVRLVWRLVTADRGGISSCVLFALSLLDSSLIGCVVGRSGKVSLASVVCVWSFFPLAQCLGKCPVSFRFREAVLLLVKSFSV